MLDTVNLHSVFTRILAQNLVKYCDLKAYNLTRVPGQVNILYLEGSNEYGIPNADRADEWNDRRIVLMFDHAGYPYIAHNEAATTEPGLSATMAKKALALGGVARIAFGQFQCWIVGYHKTQPALVQCAPIPVHRDRNQDGKRTGDPIGFASGLNQHSTRVGYTGGKVGTWSEGCLVGMLYARHLVFMAMIKNDPRYKVDKKFIFSATIIAGDHFAKVTAAV